jgi:hypothetical protein
VLGEDRAETFGERVVAGQPDSDWEARDRLLNAATWGDAVYALGKSRLIDGASGRRGFGRACREGTGQNDELEPPVGWPKLAHEGTSCSEGRTARFTGTTEGKPQAEMIEIAKPQSGGDLRWMGSGQSESNYFSWIETLRQ